MKTTLVIDETVMKSIKEKAARDRTTISEIVEAALRSYLEPKEGPRDLPPIPTWDMGPLRVDVSDREALYDLLDNDEHKIRRGILVPRARKRR